MEISNDTGILGSDIRALKDQLASARGHLKQLDSSMERLNGMWSGPASSTIKRRFAQDFEYITNACNLLECFFDKLEAARHSYESCEFNVSNVVSSIHIS